MESTLTPAKAMVPTKYQKGLRRRFIGERGSFLKKRAHKPNAPLTSAISNVSEE
jgi:hypothetical protein